MPLEAAIAYGAADAVMPYGAAAPLRPASPPALPEASARPPPGVTAPPVAPPPEVWNVASPTARPETAEGSPASFRLLTAKLKRGGSPAAPPPPIVAAEPPPPVAAAPPAPAAPPAAVSPPEPVSVASSLRRPHSVEPPQPVPLRRPAVAEPSAAVQIRRPAPLEVRADGGLRRPAAAEAAVPVPLRPVAVPAQEPPPEPDSGPAAVPAPDPVVEIEPVAEAAAPAAEAGAVPSPVVERLDEPAYPADHAPGPPPWADVSATALLDIMWGALDLPPQERTLAGDALLMLLPHLAERELALLAERVAAMDQPPPMLLSRLIRDPRPEIGGVVLERTPRLSDEDVIAAASWADIERLRLLARRRSVPPLLSDHLVSSGDLLSLLALLRNAGAEISFASFLRLAALAGHHPSLRAPLAMRPDLPLAVALELFWGLPPELRRVVMTRYLSDSVTLGRILGVAGGSAAAENPPAVADIEAALQPLFAGNREAAAQRFAELAGVSRGTVLRIFGDEEGEALVALFKALGMGRTRFEDALDRVRAATGLLRAARPSDELKAVFDGLSFNKARVLLTYWDWFMRKSGPYAPAG